MTSDHRPREGTHRRPPPFAAPLLFGGAAVIVLVVHLATNGTLGSTPTSSITSIPAGIPRSDMSTFRR
jgi:hypothetical protein